MSTKTSIKRIALVAAAALTLGGFTAVSAHATTNSAWTVSSNNVTSLTLKSATTTPTNNAAVYVNVGGIFTSVVAGGATSGVFTTLRGALTTYPAAGFKTVAGSTNVAGASAGTPTAIVGGTETTTATGITGGVAGSLFIEQTTDAAGLTGATVTTSATTGVGSFTFTPTVAGTYVMTVWNDYNNDGVVGATEAQQQISITVGGATGWSQGLTTTYLGLPATIPAPAVGAEANGATLVKTLGGQVANVLVSIKGTNAAAYSGQTVTATMSGSGFVGTNASVLNVVAGVVANASDVTTAAGGATTTRTASITDTTGYVAFGIFADGTAGTGTVTISVTDQVSGATTTIATKTVTFTGNVTKLAITANYSVGRSGGYNVGYYASMDVRDVASKVPAFVVKATDANGNPVGGLSLSGTTTDTAVSAGPTCIGDSGNATYGSGGAGYYNCYFTTAVSSVSGNKATIGVKILDPADSTNTTYLTATTPITIGGKVASTSVALNESSFAPGAAMTITISAKDSAGNPVYDGAAEPALSASKSLGGAGIIFQNGVFIGGSDTTDTSKGVKTVYAPALAGDFTVNGIGTDASATAFSVTATVTDDAASGSSSLALDAANAATDAANNAYDEAQNATQAASDALAAVTALSAQVSALIATVKSLAAMVAKIKAKVKA
jgi:hypothetical protein